jgi:hypothetical protein
VRAAPHGTGRANCGCTSTALMRQMPRLSSKRLPNGCATLAFWHRWGLHEGRNVDRRGGRGRAAPGRRGAMAGGGPSTPVTKDSISQVFSNAEYSTVPSPRRFVARDGTSLAYRTYAGSPERGSVVLVHGSSATSQSMHPLAVGLAAAGYTVYALDIRGHGDSGRKGHIAYVGQLEDDLADFLSTSGWYGRMGAGQLTLRHGRREHIARIKAFEPAQQRHGLRAQIDRVRLARLHLRRRNYPDGRVKIELTPFSRDRLVRTCCGEHRELQAASGGAFLLSDLRD